MEEEGEVACRTWDLEAVAQEWSDALALAVLREVNQAARRVDLGVGAWRGMKYMVSGRANSVIGNQQGNSSDCGHGK